MGQSRRDLVANLLDLGDTGSLSHCGSSFLAFGCHVYNVMQWCRQRCRRVLSG